MSWKNETSYYTACTALFYLYNLATQFLFGQANGILFYSVTGTIIMVVSSRSIGLPRGYAIAYFTAVALSLYYYNNIMLSALGQVIGCLVYNVSATIMLIATTHLLLSMIHTRLPSMAQRTNERLIGSRRRGAMKQLSRCQRSRAEHVGSMDPILSS